MSPFTTPPDPAAATASLAEQLLDLLPLAIMMTDAERRVTYANAGYRTLFGLSAREPDVVGLAAQEVLALIAPYFVEPAALITTVEEFAATARAFHRDRWLLTDGRTIEREVVRRPDGGWLFTIRDVTEAARLQVELEAVASIAEHNPNPIIRYAADGTPLFINKVAREGRDQLPSGELHEVRHQFHWLGELALRTGQVQRVEMSLQGMRFEISTVPFPEQQCYNLYMIDRTARYKAEQALEQQKNFYEQVLDRLPADVAVLTPDTMRYRYVNPQAIRSREVREWVIGHDDLEYFAYRNRPLDEALRRQRAWRRALDQRRAIHWDEVIERGPESEWRYMRRYAQPVFDESGRPTMLIGYGIDITEIRAAQRIHEQAEKRYRDLMHYSYALICTHTLDGRVLSVNPAVTELLGLPESRLVGRHIGLAVPRADRVGVMGYLRQFAAPDTHTSGVMRLQPAGSGEVRYLLYHNVRVDEPGHEPYIIGYAQEVTERIRADQATRHAKEVAEAAVKARTSFLTNMSHEIRTPLNGILGLAGQLAKTPLSPDQRYFVDLIGTSGNTLLALLNNVLDLSKISSHHMELVDLPFDLATTLHHVLEPLRLRAEEKRIALELVPLALPVVGVRSDSVRLVQVLTNLVANAVRFTERGYVRLEARLRASTPEAVTVTFLVRDSGIGIAPEMQERVFEEFTQANSDISRRYGGTGLGLAISTQLVTLFGSHLLLTSEPGQGTTFGFTLRLPRAELPVPEPEEEEMLPSSSTTFCGRRILIVEDNGVNRMLVRLLLVSYGAEVVEAANGELALAIIQRATPFDVILMDIQMPVMDGVAATTAIRALPDPARAQVPILALTANAFHDDVARYLAAGFTDCLTKPFEEGELLRRLVRLLGLPPSSAPVEPTPPAAAFPTTALRIGHGQLDFVRQLVAEFLAETPPLLTELTAPATPEGRVSALAHQLKATARLLDAEELFLALDALETLPADHSTRPDMRDYAAQLLADLLAEAGAWLQRLTLKGS